MKFTKKLICLMMALVTVFSVSLGACNNNSNDEPNTETDLTISFWKAGWGDEYIKSVITDFEEAYPEYNVDLQSSTDGFVFASTIDHGAEMNNIDLYIGSFMQTPYNEGTLALNDLYEKPCYGETMTLGEKLGKTYSEGMKYPDGNIYGVPHVGGGYQGLVYNAEIIGEGTDYEIPVTTDELDLLVMNLLDDPELTNVKPFIHYGSGDYWQRVYQQWWIQYDGIDAYYDFIALKDADGNAPVKDVLTTEDGRWEAISVLESIITEDTVYKGSNNLGYQQAQTFFMNGQAVMMANGSWLVNEMKSNTEASAKNLKMMRTPVISSIIDKLEDIDDDEELAALIRKMDDDVANFRGTATNGPGYSCTQADIDRVREARFVEAPGCDTSLMVIPEYAVAKDAAQDFILFLMSDNQLKKQSEILHSNLALEGSKFTVDTTDWLDFELSAMDLSKNSIPVLFEAVGIKHKIFTVGGMAIWNTSPIVAFCQTDNLSKEKYWEDLVNYYEGKWDKALEYAEAA